MGEKVNCPYCGKEMEINKSPFSDLVNVECRKCHIYITVSDLNDVESILRYYYRGQWNFEMKYVNGEIEYARIGGGRRPLPTKEEE